MFKALLKEVGRSLRGHAKPESAEVPVSDASAALRLAFAQASPEARAALVHELEQRLRDRAADPGEWALLGDWLLQLRRLVEAEGAYREALKHQPLQARAQEGLGLVLLQSGRLEEAFLHLETANKAEPNSADILVHWGLVDLEWGNLGAAARKFERALERDNQNAHAWHNLGLVALKQGHAIASIHHLERAVALKPDHGLAYSNLALAYRQAERADDALTAARRATELKLGNARVWVILGDMLINAGRFAEAEEAFQQGLALEPHSAAVYIGLGKLYAASGRPGEARSAYEQALSLSPGQADARGGLAQLDLLLARWNTGWELYEARRETEGSPVRKMPCPEWDGLEAPSSGTLLVHAEQGLGDILLFLSCMPDLLARLSFPCQIEAPPRLQALLARSFPHARVVEHEPADRDLSWLQSIDPVARHLPLGSLPRLLRRRAADFPLHRGYLQAEPDAVQRWREQLAELPGPRLGIAWRGGLVGTARAQRTLSLAMLAQALAPLGGSLVCLQYGDVNDEIEALHDSGGPRVAPGLSGYGSLDEMAALTCAVDAVVTVCSTQAHLTGALGRPGVVLVPANPNWRYGASGERMPWYPSLQLLRQPALDNWHTPLAALPAAVATLLQPPTAPAPTP